MALVKFLTKQGNSYALRIDKALMELIDIDATTPLTISTTDGRSLLITPMHSKEETFQKALQQVNKKYHRTLKKLAE